MTSLIIILAALLAVNGIGCQSSGRYESGDFSLTWTNYHDSISFKFVTSFTYMNTDMWSAFAFSLDQQMGNDNVCVCVKSDRFGNTMRNYYNTNQRQSVPLDPSNVSIGFSNIKVNLVDKSLECSFVRLKSLPSVSNYFDLNENRSFYLLTAFGRVDATGVIQYHGTDKFASQKTFYFNDVTSQSTTTALTTTHNRSHRIIESSALLFASHFLLLAAFFL